MIAPKASGSTNRSPIARARGDERRDARRRRQSSRDVTVDVVSVDVLDRARESARIVATERAMSPSTSRATVDVSTARARARSRTTSIPRRCRRGSSGSVSSPGSPRSSSRRGSFGSARGFSADRRDARDRDSSSSASGTRRERSSARRAVGFYPLRVGLVSSRAIPGTGTTSRASRADARLLRRRRERRGESTRRRRR